MATERTIRKILVALDTSPSSLSALDAAGELAASLQAELIGLFVEDEELLALTNLPLAGEVDVFSAHLRPLDRPKLERQLRWQADRAHRALAEVAQRVRVNWSFRVQRGRVSREVLAASTDVDLIILGRSGASPAGQQKIGSTAEVVLTQSRCMSLFLKKGVCLGRPVLVLYDGSEAADRALDMALQLLAQEPTHLTVLIQSSEAAYGKVRTELVGRLRKRGTQARYRHLDRMEVEALVDAVEAEGGGILVLPGTNELLRSEIPQSLLGRLECPALVVR